MPFLSGFGLKSEYVTSAEIRTRFANIFFCGGPALYLDLYSVLAMFLLINDFLSINNINFYFYFITYTRRCLEGNVSDPISLLIFFDSSSHTTIYSV